MGKCCALIINKEFISDFHFLCRSSVQRWTSSLGSLASVYPPQYKQGPVPPPCDQAMADISNQRKVYRPPTNSVFIKVPRVSPSEAPSTGAGGLGAGAVILCVDCDSKFADNKSLVKHTRNQHQVQLRLFLLHWDGGLLIISIPSRFTNAVNVARAPSATTGWQVTPRGTTPRSQCSTVTAAGTSQRKEV